MAPTGLPILLPTVAEKRMTVLEVSVLWHWLGSLRETTGKKNTGDVSPHADFDSMLPSFFFRLRTWLLGLTFLSPRISCFPERRGLAVILAGCGLSCNTRTTPDPWPLETESTSWLNGSLCCPGKKKGWAESQVNKAGGGTTTAGVAPKILWVSRKSAWSMRNPRALAEPQSIFFYPPHPEAKVI